MCLSGTVRAIVVATEENDDAVVGDVFGGGDDDEMDDLYSNNTYPNAQATLTV